MGTTTLHQLDFRIRNDDGSESAATWRQAQSSNDTIGKDLNFRVRFLIDEQNGAAWSAKTFNLYYSTNGTNYYAVTGSTPVFFSVSGNFADGDDCTSQLSGGVGTFVDDNNGMKETTGGCTNSGSKNYYFETEWCLQLDEGQLSNGNTVYLRIYDGSSALASYIATPAITYTSATTSEKAGGGTSIIQASGAKSLIFAEVGTGAVVIGRGAGANLVTHVYPRAGSATSVFAGAGASDYTPAAPSGDTYEKVGGARSVIVGVGADAWVATDSGGATAILLGGGADAQIAVDSGGGLAVFLGSGGDAQIAADSGGGIATLSGGGTKEFTGATTYQKAGGATTIVLGAGFDALVYVDIGGGSTALAGSGPSTHIASISYAKTGGASTIAWTGGASAIIWVETGGSTVPMVGNGAIAYVPAVPDSIWTQLVTMDTQMNLQIYEDVQINLQIDKSVKLNRCIEDLVLVMDERN